MTAVARRRDERERARKLQLELPEVERRGPNESKYKGNSERCPGCSIRYGDFKCGIKFREVASWLWNPSDDPRDWRYRRRGTVLGKMHQVKREYWADHLKHCRPVQSSAEIRGLVVIEEVPF